MRTLKTPQRPRVTPQVPVPVDSGLDWGAAGWAGLAGGAAFLVILTIGMIIAGAGGLAGAVRLLASVALGESVLGAGQPAPALVFLAAAAVHLQLSMIYARILAGIVDRMERPAALLMGASFGAVLYLINYYALSTFFPWFVSARGPSALVAHLVFGVVVAAVYKRLTDGRRLRY